MGAKGEPLIGRDAERAMLAAILDRCAEGVSSATVLTGEAGVGKTRLLAAAEEMAAERRVTCIHSAFVVGEEDVPLAALRRGLDELPVPGSARRQMESLLRTTTGRDIRYQLVDTAIEASMDVIEAHQPILLLIEDAQWADAESLQVLRAVVRRSADRSVAFLLAARPIPRPLGLARLLQMPGLQVQEVTLGPLSAPDLDELVLARTGGRAGPRLRTELQRTGGNALLATELLEEGRRSGVLVVEHGRAEVIAGADLHAPDLTAHVGARLGTLSARARQVITLTALSDLTPVQLARLLDTTVSAASDAIGEAVVDGLVVASGTHLQLRHDLLREAVLEHVPDAVRAGLHVDLSRVLAEDGADLISLAPHLVSGGGQGDDGLTTVAEAGRQLVSSAPRLAVSLLRRAREGGVSGLEVDLAFALILLGDTQGAREMVECLGPQDDEQARARLAAAQLNFLRGDLRAASRRFEEAGTHLPPGPERQIAFADAAISSLLIGQLDRTLTLALRAGTRRPAGAHLASAGSALLIRGWVAALRGDVRRGEALARRGHALALSPDAEADANQPDFFMAQVLVWAEQPRAAEAAVERGQQRADEIGMGWIRSSLHAVQADLDIRAGRWEDAESELETALTFAQDFDVDHGVPWCLSDRAMMTIGRGDDPSALLQAAEQAVGRLSGQGADLVLWMRGLNHLTLGRHAEAAQVLGFLWGRLDAAGALLRRVHIASDLMRAAVVADPERATAVVAWLEEVVALRDWPRATAVLTHAKGLLAGVGVLMSQAAAAMSGLEDPVAAARMHVDAACAMPGREGATDRRRAAQVLQYAGAHAWLAPLDGAPATAASQRPTQGWASLTPSQARIVDLVGQGLGNQAIAVRLSVSRRTVESHLYHSYAKLDIASRVELGLAAAQRSRAGLAPGEQRPGGA